MEKHDIEVSGSDQLEEPCQVVQPDKIDLDDPDAHLSEAEREKIDKQLLWKLDLKLIPWLSLLYLVSFLDRTNVGNAKLEGLLKDLHLTDGQYAAALTIFFVSYSVFEPVTNVLLKRLRPSIFIPVIMLIWGICMTTMGLTTNFSGFMAARWFLGLTEAGLFPGVGYFLSCWYKRSEFGVRMAIFFSAAAVAGSFGGLLAAAIAKMNGVGGKAGWAWIFILEGLVTIVIAVASFWMVQDFPDSATFLSEDDRKRVIRRLSQDKQSSAEHEEFKMSYFWARYKSTKAQLLSVPPYAVGCVLTIGIGVLADRTKKRGLCNIGVSLLGIAGFSMLIGAKSPEVRYAGTFLGAMGIYPCIANTISWASNNTEGVYKRGVTLGIIIGWGNLNGVVSSNIYRGRDAPNFFPGHGTVLGYLIVFLLGGSILQHVLLRIENGKRVRGERNSWVEGLDAKSIEMLGDKRPDFLYTL
ncbi:MFS transporter [Arthroderma uncinatum]|uniref:MFS transporter n=1 Tax=Arthroderma uncinatum TaxID=74035 RepID=UPI00144A9892|nr:MFS transporter [Arthroderma uncinatum]KAF3481783.1 MFS transporter [Arthroderma uncinatum]